MPSSNRKRVLRGSASNLLRLLLSMLVSFALPPFLVHRMSAEEYSAWVLILQLSAYVNFLDFGLSTAIGKFVAEYEATGNREASRRLVSTAFSVLCCASLIGVVTIAVLTYRVPQLFHQMPVELMRDVRLGLIAVGLSTALALPFSVFTSLFTGLQQYGFTTVLFTVSRFASAAALVALVLLHGNLLQMSVLLACFNVATAAFQFLGWRRYASDRVEFEFLSFDRRLALRLTEYCGVLSIWTLGSIFISGLDTTIVGHFDYKNTGYYAVASSATNFLLLLVGSMLGPLLPALSSTQTGRTPSQMGDLLIRATRYSTLLLCFLGLPLFLGGFPLLTAWVGHQYAVRSVLFLEILVAANAIRQLGYPYALMVVATGKQRLATVAPVAEAIVNFTFSVLLAKKMGAAGVALGTLIGAVIGLAAHFFISMYLTQAVIQVRQIRFALEGLLRPLLCIVPSLLLYPVWHSSNLFPMSPGWIALWLLFTLLLAWRVALTANDRREMRRVMVRLF